MKVQKKDALFIHIPRTGGHSIKEAFGDRVTYLNHHEPLRRDLYVKYEKYFKFAFVRNPWSRIASAYHGWYERCKTSSEIFPYNNFDEYVDIIVAGKSIIAKPQLWFIFDNNILVNFIGRYENFEQDFKKIVELLNVEVQLGRRLGYFGEYNYRKMYNSKTKKLIGDYFLDDITFFKYNF